MGSPDLGLRSNGSASIVDQQAEGMVGTKHFQADWQLIFPIMADKAKLATGII